MTLSPREAGLTLAAGAAALFAVSYMLAKPVVAKWQVLRQEQDRVSAELQAYKQLVAKRDDWARRIQELSEQMPQYPADKKMDIYWLSIMDQTASKDGLRIIKRQAGEEKKLGDVYEMQIACTDWEGNLESIVRFLFDLQSGGAMLDIRQLMIKPKGGGVLRGMFSLYCAYSRERKSGTGENDRRKKP